MANEDFGYGAVDDAQKTVGGGRFLQFGPKDKGKTLTLRLVSKPHFVTQHWVLGADGKQSPVICGEKECVYCGDKVPANERLDKKVQFGWIVVDREDGQVKLFKGAFMIAKDIQALSKDEAWGNPMTYDLKITRTEETGSYYKTMPVPQGMGDITAEEKKAVEEANIDLKKELVGSKESKTVGNYSDLETADAVEGTPVAPEGEATPKNEVEESMEVDVDDIPF